MAILDRSVELTTNRNGIDPVPNHIRSKPLVQAAERTALTGETVKKRGLRTRRTLRQAANWLLALALPIFTGLYAPVHLLSSNNAEVNPPETVRSARVLAIVAIAIPLTLMLLVRSVTKASLTAE